MLRSMLLVADNGNTLRPHLARGDENETVGRRASERAGAAITGRPAASCSRPIIAQSTQFLPHLYSLQLSESFSPLGKRFLVRDSKIDPTSLAARRVSHEMPTASGMARRRWRRCRQDD